MSTVGIYALMTSRWKLSLGRLAMRLENEALELELIAKAIQAISKETSYEGLAKALLNAALRYCGAARGAVLLSEKGELLDKADASFPRERARFFASHLRPATSDCRRTSAKGCLHAKKTVVREDSWEGSALIDPAECRPGRTMAQLCLPLIHRERTIGVLYLESERKETFTPRCVSVISMLASQAAVSFESHSSSKRSVRPICGWSKVSRSAAWAAIDGTRGLCSREHRANATASSTSIWT